MEPRTAAALKQKKLLEASSSRLLDYILFCGNAEDLWFTREMLRLKVSIMIRRENGEFQPGRLMEFTKPTGPIVTEPSYRRAVSEPLLKLRRVVDDLSKAGEPK